MSKILSNIELCCCSLGDRPADCTATVVGHDLTIMYEDLWKSHRTHQLSKQISVQQVTDCLTQIINKRGSIPSRIVLLPFHELQRKKLEEKLLQYQEKSTQVDARTAEPYNKQKNDITELVVRTAKNAKNTMQRESPAARFRPAIGVFCGPKSEKT